MRRTKFLLIFIVMAIIGFLSGCTGMSGPEKGALTKITARRIGFNGFTINPELFTSMGEIASEACNNSQDNEQVIDTAFEVIVRSIATEAQDPLLAQDLKDVAELIGIKFDGAFTSLGLTEDKQKFISFFVCAFDQGVQAAKTTSK